MECYLLSEPKIRGYRKRMLSLWLQKGMFWVSEQRLVDQANTIHRNSWMTELEIEELERKVWNVKAKIIPLVVGSLGAIIPKQFGNRLKQIGITGHFSKSYQNYDLHTNMLNYVTFRILNFIFCFVII